MNTPEEKPAIRLSRQTDGSYTYRDLIIRKHHWCAPSTSVSWRAYRAGKVVEEAETLNEMREAIAEWGDEL